MQDRINQSRRNPLAPHGRTIHWVNRARLAGEPTLPFYAVSDPQPIKTKVSVVPILLQKSLMV
jgi:hypothetical protein